MDCADCLYYRLKKEGDRARGYRGYCSRFTISLRRKGYLVDRMYYYAEVPDNGFCDEWERR